MFVSACVCTCVFVCVCVPLSVCLHICTAVYVYTHQCMCVCPRMLNMKVCVWEREKERESLCLCECVREPGRDREIVCGWDTFWQSSPFFRNNHLFPLQRQSRLTPGLLRRQSQTKKSLSLSPSVSFALSRSWSIRPLSLWLLTRGCGCHWRRWG